MTNSISEIEFNDALFIIGSNAPEAHPIIGSKMKRAKRNGAKLVVVDPRKTELAEMADVWMQIIPGTDNALINGMMNVIISNGWEDREYIESRCEGYDELWEVVKNYPPHRAAALTGIPEELIIEGAEIYAKTRKAGIYYTLGITEHTTGTANVMNLANLAMVTGHVGFESAGVNPIRGQNNVQGACDMGALPNVFPGYRSAGQPKEIEAFEQAWGVELNPGMGLTIPEMIDMAVYGKLKAMYVMGEDPVLTDPDANHVRKAMENLEFLVVQDLFMTQTAQYADVFLPAASYAEKSGTFTNTERRVQRVRQAIEPLGQARADWEIICDLSKRLGYEMNYSNVEEIFQEVRKLTPIYAGITYPRIEKDGIQWPCPTETHPGTKFLHAGVFPRGKGLMSGIEYEEAAELTNEEYPILMTTGRMLYQYNVSTRYSANLDRLRPYELAEINPREAEALGVKEEDQIRVTSRRGSIITKVTITDKVAPGVMFMTFHYWESPVNELTNSAYDPVSNTAEYKVSAVKIEKV